MERGGRGGVGGAVQELLLPSLLRTCPAGCSRLGGIAAAQQPSAAALTSVSLQHLPSPTSHFLSLCRSTWSLRRQGLSPLREPPQ